MVRFADGPTTDATRQVDAPPEAVWPHVVDVTLPVASSEELVGAEWEAPADGGEGGPALGAVFLGHNARGDLRWTTRCTVVACEAPHRFAWRVDAGEEQVATWGYELSPAEGGGTAVRQWTLLGPGRSGLTWAITQDPEREEEIVEGRLADLREAMGRNLDVLAARLAGSSAGGS